MQQKYNFKPQIEENSICIKPQKPAQITFRNH